jgi:hypothetical protein
VAHMGKNLRESDPFEDQGVGRRIILKQKLKK